MQRSRSLSGVLLPLPLLLAACGTSAPIAESTAPAPQPGAAAPAPTAGAPAANAAPDQPSGEAAKRVAVYARKVEPVVYAFVNSAPHLTPNGRKVIFASSRDGLGQLYVADAGKPESTAVRITTPERVPGGESFDGKTIIFRSDKGADENWSLFRVGLDGSDLVELTPGEKLQRDLPYAPRRRKGTIYYSARDQAKPETTVFALDLDPKPAAAAEPEAGAEAGAAPGPRRVYQDAVQGGLYDVSPDGKLGLFVRRTRRTSNTLLLVDLAAGTARPVYPAQGDVGIWDARFSADGKRMLVATDGGGEDSFLLALDTATGKELARHAETSPRTAQVNQIEVSPAGRLIAIAVDAGHQVQIRLLDARSLAVRRTLEPPPGTGALGQFSHDGGRLTFTWSTPDKPTDVYSAATGSGKVTSLRTEPRPSLTGLPAVEVTSTEVKSFDGTPVPVNVYLPAGASGKRLPVIVSYHGGPAGVSKVGWSSGVRFFTSLGYAFVDPNVRGSSGYGRAYEMADNGPKRLDAFKDVEAVGRWVAEQPWADRDRLVVYGGSYGGYTVLIALTRMPDLWRAGVDLFGVVNMHTFLRSTTGYIREIFKLEFGDLEKDTAFLESISPHRDVAKIADPLFVYAGANDPRVPKTECDQIVVALRQRGVPVEYMVKDNEGHSLARRENQIEFYSRVAHFLEVHLADKPR
jgi:dipeptidyl aminopeptidase/acylaminoacyl peptidase